MSELASEITVYTDGACHGNPGPGGYGIVMMSDGQRQELSGGFSHTTNNRMELFSVIRALREIKPSPARVTIYSDAQYVVNMINGGYAQRWRQNGWTRNKGKDKAMNPDLWGDLLDLCSLHEVKFIWVRGHSSNKENERCDELAVAARLLPDLPVDAGYVEKPAVVEKPVVPEQQMQMDLFDSLLR